MNCSVCVQLRWIIVIDRPYHMLGIVSLRAECERAGLTSEFAAEGLSQYGVDIDRSTSDALPSTTLEESGSGLRYRVVDGCRLERHLPEFTDFYRTVLLDVARSMVGEDLVLQDKLRGALSLNEIKGGGGRYERHVDDSSYTAVLYFETRTISDGCALEFESEGSPGTLRIFPVEYLLAVFTGRDWTHAVSPNLSSSPRRCLVANYWLAGTPQDRPEDLDDYLYGPDTSLATATLDDRS